MQNMRHLYDRLVEEDIKQTAMHLIDTVEDDKYKKKYMNVWK
ncbi:hypothetical protein [Terribacillus saccharophilus]|nr:hypothetical protein [Terribacillus saccharophilus]